MRESPKYKLRNCYLYKQVMIIRQLNNFEYEKAITLALDVFIECGSANFDANGLQTFKSFIHNEELMSELTIFGAFDNDALIGIIGTKNAGSHISLFFIHPKFHRMSVGRQLFDFAYVNRLKTQITVNSSSYAVKFYKSLGFSKIADEQETNGLRYTPMRKE